MLLLALQTGSMQLLRPAHTPKTLALCGRPTACRTCFAAAIPRRRPAALRMLRRAAAAFAESDDQRAGWQGSQQDLRAIWDSVPRPLLRVGKAGVQASHGSSLAELLAQHGLVKVQLNAACEGPDAAGAQLAEAAGGRLLQYKGRTLLLAPAHSREDDLLLSAHAATQQKAAVKTRRQQARQQSASGAVQLRPPVAAKLRSLQGLGVVAPTDFDSLAIRALAALPEDTALSVLDQCTKARLRATRNRSAWLTSQCRRLERPAQASSS